MTKRILYFYGSQRKIIGGASRSDISNSVCRFHFRVYFPGVNLKFPFFKSLFIVILLGTQLVVRRRR